MTKRKPQRFTAFLWHRRIGLFAMLLVIILALTGILLNHTEELKLDESYVDSGWLLGWYGIEPEGEASCYRLNNDNSSHLVCSWQDQLFFDNNKIAVLEQTMHGAIGTEQFIVIALDNEIILLSPQGEFVERITTSISFSNIQRIGVKYERPVIETSDPYYYIADEHILDWDIISNEGIHWAEKHLLSEDQRQQLLLAFRGNGLKLERVILDLHSGRIFGSYGIYLMDAAAVALLWLGFSGLWIWSSRRRKMHNKKHYRKHH